MVRYTPKNNEVLFGWESAFKDVAGSGEAVSVLADIDWVLNLESLEVTELKPKTERIQKWFIGNNSRIISYTYDTEYKVGGGSFAGELKHGHVLDAVLGGTVTTDKTTFDKVVISVGDRKSFFTHYEHGSTHIKDIIGCVGIEVSIDAKEGDFVSYDMSIIAAKILPETSVDNAINTSTLGPLKDVDTPPFHWKHCSVNLSLDGGVSIYTSKEFNQVESAKLTFKSNTEFKFGAPSSGGQKNANWFKTMKFEAIADLTLYPEDEALWLFSPSESEYLDYYKSPNRGSVKYDTLVGAFAVGDTVTGATSSATGVIASDHCYGITHKGNVNLSAGFDWGLTPQDFSINVNGAGATTVNLNTTCANLADVISEINTELGVAGVTGVEAYDAGTNFVGIRTTEIASGQSIILATGVTDALVTLGWTAGTYNTPNSGTLLLNNISGIFVNGEDLQVSGVEATSLLSDAFSLFSSGNKGSVRYDTLVGAFAYGDTVTGASSLATGVIVYDHYYGIYHAGTANLSAGHDWTISDSFSINVNGAGAVVITLDANCADLAAVIAEINAEFEEEYITDVEAYDAGSNHVGIRTIGYINNQSFILAAGGGTALTTLGWTANTYNSPTSGILFLKDISGGPFQDGENLEVSGVEATAVPVGAYSGGNIHLTVLYKRDTHDFIKVVIENFSITTMSENLENIDAGVDPLTLSMQLARYTSNVGVEIHDPLYDNSYSVPY